VAADEIAALHLALANLATAPPMNES
jgi:hypothetical protein